AKRFVESWSATSGLASSSGHTVRPALVSVASILASGENASGPEAPGSRRSSFQLDVSQRRTPSRHTVARRVPSAETATGPEFSGSAFSSFQSVVFQARTVVGLAVTSLLPSGKNAIEMAPLGRLTTNDRVRRSHTLNFSRNPTATRSPPGET